MFKFVKVVVGLFVWFLAFSIVSDWNAGVGALIFFSPLVYLVGFPVFNFFYKSIHGKETPWVATAAAAKERRAAELARVEAEKKRLLEAKQQAVINLINKHKRALKSQYLKLVTKSPYGKSDHSKWFDEEKRFIAEVILDAYKLEDCGYTYDELRDLVGKMAIGFAYESPASNVDAMNPIEFEHHCAALLRGAGWDAKMTKGSGDQGVDLIADKGERRLAVQCKLYSAAVGNAAVQEIVAGMQYVSATYGAVVTNSSYTPAAVELARANGIALLHVSDLPSIDELLVAA